jgi:predicted Fe-Mo cluster-binding NifX family protein
MKIAVASQNRRTITGHAGKCRKFWIYHLEPGVIPHKELLELPREQSFHDSSPHDAHPLDDIQVLIAGGMGSGLQQRLAAKGIQSLITPETDPDKAVTDFLEGTLVREAPHPHFQHGGHHGHGHHCGCRGEIEGN